MRLSTSFSHAPETDDRGAPQGERGSAVRRDRARARARGAAPVIPSSAIIWNPLRHSWPRMPQGDGKRCQNRPPAGASPHGGGLRDPHKKFCGSPLTWHACRARVKVRPTKWAPDKRIEQPGASPRARGGAHIRRGGNTARRREEGPRVPSSTPAGKRSRRSTNRRVQTPRSAEPLRHEAPRSKVRRSACRGAGHSLRADYPLRIGRHLLAVQGDRPQACQERPEGERRC